MILNQPIETASQMPSGGEHLYDELWISLASLLRSYVALYSFHSNCQTTVDQNEEKIAICQHEKLFILARNHAFVTWTRENGDGGTLELTESGTLRGPVTEEPMDLVAEQWARELVR